MKTQLVVLGAGPGGYAAAFLAADLGMEVALVDREPRLGGVCLLRGCIPSKALLHVAKAIAEAGHLADWGVDFKKPKIDVDKVRKQKEKVIATLTGGLGQLAKKRNVKVVRARATFAGSNALELQPVGDNEPEDNRLEFDHCILATGSRPMAIPGLEVDGDRVMNSGGALDLPDVPQRLLVVGGGYIGLEMGTVYAALGSKVTVVEMTDGLLPGADRDLVRPLSKRLEKQFEAIHLNAKVTSLEVKGSKVEVQFEGDVEKSKQSFDRVLVSVGRRPNSDGLGLENTQVEVDDRGFVRADEKQRTADPAILAIGDVAGEPMLAHKAAHQGKAAVEALAGEPAVFDPRAIPAVVFTDPEVAWAGVTETDAKRAGREVQTAVFPWGASGRAQAVGRTEGLTKWVIDPETERLIGCGIVGYGAGDLIGEAVLAIEMGCAVRDVVDTIHPHPTLGETLGFAAEVHLGTATDLYRPKRK
jgi:dihydrolipoamide dehydrogenase